MSRFKRCAATALGLLLSCYGVSALAQAARSGGSASTQLMQQMQQMASERTTLQAENERLKGELASVKKDRDALKAAQQAVDRRSKDATEALAHSKTQRDAVEQELTQNKEKMQELIAKFRETIQKLRETETEGATAKQALATRDRELAACTDRNAKLYQLNEEVLTRLQKRGVWSRAAESEPFTQIARVRLENLADDYRARAQDLTLRPAAAPDAGSPPATPPPPTVH